MCSGGFHKLQLACENLFHSGLTKYIDKANKTMLKVNYKGSRTICQIFF